MLMTSNVFPFSLLARIHYYLVFSANLCIRFARFQLVNVNIHRLFESLHWVSFVLKWFLSRAAYTWLAYTHSS